MGVPTSEVVYTIATTRRETTEVRITCGGIGERKKCSLFYIEAETLEIFFFVNDCVWSCSLQNKIM
jgi:hypothetical protein